MGGAFDLPTAATCGPTCHGDMDYGFMYDDIRAQFDAVKAPLDKLNMQLYAVVDKMTVSMLKLQKKQQQLATSLLQA